ncbi:serine/threonine-protein kinase, partial [Actinomadura adrarensis]
VLDFGVAVGLAPGDARRTATGAGAPFALGYTPPEQLYGSPCPQSDLYALGCVLYELLTGRQVFPGDTPYEVMRRHEDETPPPLRDARPDVPEDFEALILQMLAKQPADRPASALDVYERAVGHVNELVPLPGAVEAVTGPSPNGRLYGSVHARIRLAAHTPSRAPVVEPPHASEPVELPTHERVAKTRVEAADLAAEGRYTQAAELLSDLAEPAALALGEDDPEVLNLRLDLAAMLYQGGDYRRAIPAYRVAAAGLTEWYGPDDEKVL